MEDQEPEEGIHGWMTLTKILVPICLYCLKCTQLWSPDVRLKCTKFDFGCGSAPDPVGGAYSVPPDPSAVFKGPTSKRRGREGNPLPGLTPLHTSH